MDNVDSIYSTGGESDGVDIEVITSAEVKDKAAADLSSVRRYHHIEKMFEDGIIENINERNAFLDMLETINYERGLIGEFNMQEIMIKRILDLSIYRGRNYFLPVLSSAADAIPLSISANPIECIDKGVIVARGPGEILRIDGFVARRINKNNISQYSSLRQVINIDSATVGQVSPIREYWLIGSYGSATTGRGFGIVNSNIDIDIDIEDGKIVKDISSKNLIKYYRYYLFHAAAIIKSGYGYFALGINAADHAQKVNLGLICLYAAQEDISLIDRNMVLPAAKEAEKEVAKEAVKAAEYIKIIEEMFSVSIIDDSDIINIGNEVFIYKTLAEKFGTDSAAAKFYITFLRERERAAKLERIVEAKRIKDAYEENIMFYLLEKKLGSKRYAAVTAALAARPYISLDVIKSILTPDERIIITKEKSLYEANIKAMAANKCKHLRLVRKLRQELNPKVAAEMITSEVSKYYDSTIEECKKAAKLIGCNNCKFELICPHYIEMINTMARVPAARAASGNASLREVMAPYMSDIVGGSYFCRICNELITTIDVLGSIYIEFDAGLFSSMEDPLIAFLMPEVSSACRFLVASAEGSIVSLPMTKVVKSAVSGIYKYMLEIEKLLSKAKTNSAADNENKKILFTAIYTYAYLANIAIATNLDKESKFKLALQPSSAAGGTIPTSNSAVDILKTAVGNILNTKNVIISKIKGMTPEFIKDKVVEAFKVIAAAKGTTALQIPPVEDDIFISILLDPIFQLAYTADKIASGSKKVVDRFDIVEKFNEILGADLKKLKEAAEMKKRKKIKTAESEKAVLYANLKRPKITAAMTAPFINCKMPAAGENIKNICAKYDLIEAARFWFCTDSMIDNFSKGKYLEYNTAASDKVKAETWTLLHPASRIADQYRILLSAKNSVLPPFVSDNHFSRMIESAGLASSYDVSGKRHSFDIYIDPSGKDVKKADSLQLPPQATSGTFWKDRKCSICNILWSKAFGKIDPALEESIINTLREKSDIESILRFYENRCPGDDSTGKGNGQHSFADGKCSKCGYAEAGRNQENAREFFKKYRKIFLRDKDAEMYGDSLQVKTDKYPAAPLTIEKLDRIGEGSWKNEYMAAVSTAAKFIDTEGARILYIGMADRREFADLMAGRITDDLVSSEVNFGSSKTATGDRDDFRALLVHSYCKIIIMSYNQLRFRIGGENDDKIDPDILSVIKSSGVKKHELAALAQELPPLPGMGFNAADGVVPAKFYARLFAQLIIAAFEAAKTLKNPEKTKLVNEYIKYIAKRILKEDQLRSIPGRFNWNVFKAEETALNDLSEGDSNFDENAGVEDEEGMKRAELGSTADVTKNSFDIDVDVDEGQTEDEVMEDNSIAEID